MQRGLEYKQTVFTDDVIRVTDWTSNRLDEAQVMQA